MKALPLSEKHMELAEIDTVYMEDIVGEFVEKFPLFEKVGESMTLMEDGRIIAFAGLIILRPGVAEVWLVPTVYMTKCKFGFAKTVKFYVDKVFDVFRLHRLQTVSMENEKLFRWLSWLGFKQEGVLKAYTSSKKNEYMWAMVRI